MMNKHYVFGLLFALLLAGYPVMAQITITPETLFGIGYEYEAGGAASVTFDVGDGGANQSWTFGNYDWQYTAESVIVDPSGTPYGGDFPTATVAIQATTAGIESYTYHRIDEGGVYFLGIAGEGGTMIWDQEVINFPMPCTYGSEWTTVQTRTYEIAGITIVSVDSSINTIDGWGTLTTPYGVFSVLRQLVHNYIFGSVNGMPQPMTQNLRIKWMGASGAENVVAMSGTGETDPHFSSGSIVMMTSGVAVDPARGPVADRFRIGQNYPNPFNPTTVLPLSLAKSSRVELRIYDANGRLVSSRNFDLPMGEHSLPVDGSQWSSGTYFANIRSDADAQTVRMQLVK